MDRRHRMSSRAEFSRVLEHGARASTRTVTCFAIVEPGEGAARVGVTASRRVGSAVVRNRAKRRLREAVRPCLPSLEPGTELVLVGRPPISGSSFHQVRTDVVSALAKVGVPC